MRAYGYVRVSSIEQIKGTSLIEQRKQIETYCSFMGIELVGIFEDKAISGAKPIAERPEGSKMIEAINNGGVDTVIVCKLDRAFRSTVDCLVTVQRWANKKIGLVILSVGGQTIDTSTSMGRFFITMLAGVCELEKDLIRERCASGRASRKAEGKAIGGEPFGFQKDVDGFLIPDNREQQIIADIRELHKQGLSSNAIAKRFNEQGIATKIGGGKWTHKTVIRILKAA